ncbi:MAG: hypothetical protein ABJL99_00600 [Aliishimia sp.]
MAMKTFKLQYSVGPSNETGHITKLRNDLYRMFHIDYSRVIRRRDLNAVEYSEFMDELFDRHLQPAHDFNSIHAFRDFIAFGCFDVEQDDLVLLNAKEEILRAYG